MGPLKGAAEWTNPRGYRWPTRASGAASARPSRRRRRVRLGQWRLGRLADSDDVGRAFRLMSPIEVGRPFRLMSAGVAERPLGGCDLSITRCAWSSGDGFGRLLLAQTVALELQAMGVVDDPVEDGVGEGGLADQVVPAVDRDLAGDQRGAAAVAFFDDFQHVVALLGPKRLEAPIVEDQEL